MNMSAIDTVVIEISVDCQAAEVLNAWAERPSDGD